MINGHRTFPYGEQGASGTASRPQDIRSEPREYERYRLATVFAPRFCHCANFFQRDFFPLPIRVSRVEAFYSFYTLEVTRYICVIPDTRVLARVYSRVALIMPKREN